MALGQRDNNGRAGNLEATIQTRLGELICELLLDRARSNDELRAGQAQGGDSIWGDWSEIKETLTDDQGYEYDLDGDLVNQVIED